MEKISIYLTQTLIVMQMNRREVIEMKRLVKSQSRVLCGVCGGIGEYLNIDPTIIRLLWILFCFCGGAGIIAYIIAAIIIPEV